MSFRAIRISDVSRLILPFPLKRSILLANKCAYNETLHKYSEINEETFGENREGF